MTFSEIGHDTDLTLNFSEIFTRRSYLGYNELIQKCSIPNSAFIVIAFCFEYIMITAKCQRQNCFDFYKKVTAELICKSPFPAK